MINNQYNRVMSAQSSQPQALNSQRNVFMSDNTTLIQNSPLLGEAVYFNQQPTELNINSMNHIHPPAHFPNSHSILNSLGGFHQNTANSGAATFYDPHLTRIYTTTNGVPFIPSNRANLMENSLNASIPSQTNGILIDHFAPQLRSEQQQQDYRNATQLQHSTAARQQTQRVSEPTQQLHNYDHTEITTTTTSPTQVMQLHRLPSQTQPIFLSADAFGSTSTGKMSAYLPFKVNSSFPTNEIYQRQLQPPSGAIMPTTACANTTSPVVLDRINICINNHYTDHNFTSPVIDTAATSTNTAAETPALSSPIIPPIQHNVVIDPELLLEPTLNSNENNCTNNNVTPIPLTVNEPDSTTTSHTPPLTPDNTSSHIAALSAIQSPSTSSTAKVDELFKNYSNSCAKGRDDTVIMSEDKEIFSSSTETTKGNSQKIEYNTIMDDITQDSLPIPVDDLVTESIFAIGDDVFVKIDNDRLYLGTIIDSKYHRFRVRFDDASEMWCSPREMRKFGVSDESIALNGTGEKVSDDNDLGALCVACKKRGAIDVEICERCGRGYHKACTIENSSGDLICKRCSKPMKVDPSENICEEYENCTIALVSQRQQLPYDAETLHWDSKHRVNEEQVYCYCGRSGQFDYKMFQCCKCLNWYHTGCTQNFKDSMLRGDGFFVFCCAVCSTNGNEFLRRLQMDCVDFMHLVLYNICAQQKHLHNRYHHLQKDIWPFVLCQKETSAFPEEWLVLDEYELKNCVLSTLKNCERFVCGREHKRDHNIYSLRNNGPPSPPPALFKISQSAEINDKYLIENLKLRLSKRADENSEIFAAIQSNSIASNLANDKDDTDGKFTSDDEIPIKLILEKEKVKNKEAHCSTEKQKNEKEITTEQRKENETKLTTSKAEIKNHKRKAFKLSRPYKETSISFDNQRRNKTSNCESSSSDENSSSSRGTSLDLIIPPPKDFLGANNPFRTVTTPRNSAQNDKKSILCFGRSILSGPKTIRNSIVNASALDFSTNLAALKNAGVLPNLNTTNFSRAAGQPRMVRTIKRRLSAKDIMIGPNQEIRRRRTRRLSSNVEVISTTTINPLSSFFPINTPSSCSTKTTPPTFLRKNSFSTALPATKDAPTQITTTTINKPTAHGRRLRLRPQNSLPTTNSRRSSLSGASTTSNSSSSGNATPQVSQYSESAILSDLQQTVNKYFGVDHLITTGEQFSIHAKRQLTNGQIQLLIEWGVNDENSVNADSII